MKKKRFSIQEYLKENKITLGPLKREIGDTVYKGGHNDLRKTNYDVRLDKNGKLDLYTHKTIITEGVTKEPLNEETGQYDTVSVIFARFLIGDRAMALKQLKSHIGKQEFGNMEKAGTREWNDQFRDLAKSIRSAIKKEL